MQPASSLYDSQIMRSGKDNKRMKISLIDELDEYERKVKSGSKKSKLSDEQSLVDIKTSVVDLNESCHDNYFIWSKAETW